MGSQPGQNKPTAALTAQHRRLTVISGTAPVRAIDSPEQAHRSTARTSRTGIRDSDIARSSCVPDIFESKNGNADSALRNLSKGEQPSCVAVRRDRNFYRLA